MHPFIASSLLIVCGIVDATIYNPRSPAFNPFMERRQRSIGFQYPYGYHYNPIEPSINDIDGLTEALDSRIDTYEPIYQHVKISTHDVNPVPRTQSYQPKSPLYDSEYITAQDIPNLFPEESYDYKYLGSPLNKYQTLPTTTESDISVNLLGIRKTSVAGYAFPIYKSLHSSDPVWVYSQKMSNNFFEDSQSVETDPETYKVSSPTIRVVKLLTETSEQEPPLTTKNPYDFLHVKLLEESQNEIQNSVEDKLNHEITQETPTEESQSVDEPNMLELEENSSKEKSSLMGIEENLTEDESNSVTTDQTQTEDELNSLVFDSITTENEPNSITIEDKSNSIVNEETQTKDEESMTSQETTAFELDYASDKNWYYKSHKDLQLTIDVLNKYYKKLREKNMKSQFTTVDNNSIQSQSNLSSDENSNQQLQPQFANEADMYEDDN